MSNHANNARVNELIDSALADAMSEAGRKELEQLLLDSDEALAIYAQRCQFETALHFEIRSAAAMKRVDAAIAGLATPHTTTAHETALSQDGLPASSADELRRREERDQGRRFRRTASYLIAATLLTGFGLWFAQHRTAIAAERQPQPIARLEALDNAEWFGEQLAVGHRFVEGESVYLARGSARISMASGAEVQLRAPCFVSLEDAMLVCLEEGDLTAQVADWAHGFTVDTAALRVVDLGTKFAVSTNNLGVAEAHVLDGRVRVLPTVSNPDSPRSLLLSGGEALRIQSDSRVSTKLVADRDRFNVELSDLPPYKPIPLANTGKGLDLGDEDPHWRVVAGPGQSPSDFRPQYAVTCNADDRYLGNDPEHSQWISLSNPVRPGVPANSEFTFQTRFDLTGYDLRSIVLCAQVIADNGVKAVRINGQAVPFDSWFLNEKGQVFNRFHVINIAEGLKQGDNLVEFDVRNGVDHYESNDNPLALRVEWCAYGRPSSNPYGAGQPLADSPDFASPSS
ncbi:FecR protein [Botrimarina colliarenosi]|uniref:FecR protein n=1 Tax=Botrimarina colliarenosi TaxID=2528001 RepID=A0A5C6AHH5_9BACT|nr:FecR domain-containing protein [Botrimarina colliarenosi]TWT97633.1 FecR protein [Botrimarina colliarenosi]